MRQLKKKHAWINVEDEQPSAFAEYDDDMMSVAAAVEYPDNWALTGPTEYAVETHSTITFSNKRP